MITFKNAKFETNRRKMTFGLYNIKIWQKLKLCYFILFDIPFSMTEVKIESDCEELKVSEFELIDLDFDKLKGKING